MFNAIANFLNMDLISPLLPSKVPVECDWISKKKFHFFVVQKYMDLIAKFLSFLKIAKIGKFAVKWVSNGMISEKCLFRLNYKVFWQEKQKIVEAGNLENMKSEFSKKALSSFQKLSLQKWEGGKYAFGSRTSCK